MSGSSTPPRRRRLPKEWGRFVTLLVVVAGATIAMFAWGFSVLRGDIVRVEAALKGDIVRVEAALKGDIVRVEAALKGEITRVEATVLENQRGITALVREVSELRGELKGRDLLSEGEDR